MTLDIYSYSVFVSIKIYGSGDIKLGLNRAIMPDLHT